MKYIIFSILVFIASTRALEEDCELNKYCFNNSKHISCEWPGVSRILDIYFYMRIYKIIYLSLGF